MGLIVMKYGGTSVANTDKLVNVANIVQNHTIENKVIVVLSAMAGYTNQMQDYINEIQSDYRLENDLMLTSGENITIAILSAILKQRKLNVNHFLVGKYP